MTRRRADFMLVPWEGVRRAWLAAYADIILPESHPLYDPYYVRAVWVRPGAGGPEEVYRLFEGDYGRTIPDDGRQRAFPYSAPFKAMDNPGAVVAWGQSEGGFSPHLVSLVISGDEDAGTTIYSEVWEVLDGGGKVVHDGAGNVIPSRVLDLAPITRQSSHALSFPPAERYGGWLSECWSATPYRVAYDASWLTILGTMTWENNEPVIFEGWEYDLEGGTPDGFYDIRASVENASGMANGYKYGPARYPPPNRSRVSGRWVGGVFFYYMTMCYRWVPNSAYDPDDPTSPPFWVHAYRWAYSDQAPTDLPIDSSWTAVVPDDRTVEKEQAWQTITLSPQDFLYQDGGESARAFMKGYALEGRFRYRVPGTVRASLKGGGYSYQAAYIHLTENRGASLGGVRTMSGESIVYDDPVVGSVWREGEGAWPSNGGAIRSADLSPTLLGVKGNRWMYAALCGPIKIRPGGDFWALVIDGADWRAWIASRAGLVIELDAAGTDIVYAEAVRFSEADGKVWIVATES